MSKTEQMILSEITKRGFFSIETCYGRGPGGGRVQYGVRDRNAMFKLEKIGLIFLKLNLFRVCLEKLW